MYITERQNRIELFYPSPLCYVGCDDNDDTAEHLTGIPAVVLG